MTFFLQYFGKKTKKMIFNVEYNNKTITEYAQVYSLIILKKKLGFTLRGVAQGVLKWPKMIFLQFFGKNQKNCFQIFRYNNK